MSPTAFDAALDTTIESSPRAPAEARRAVERLDAAIGRGLLHDVQLLVSELVTNSVRHSGSNDAIRLRAWTRPGGLKVEISDGGFGFDPPQADGGWEAEGGRGLVILESLTDRWGVSHDSRARVWFEIDRRPARGGRAQAG